MSRTTCFAALAALSAFSATAIAQSADGSSKFFEHMLKKWDANDDGRISLDEYLAAAKERYQQIDSQNMGSVTSMQIANSPNAGKRIERRAEMLVTRLDNAGNGYVTQDEFIAAAKIRFAKLDKKGDGKLTPDEFALGHGDRSASSAGKPAQFAQKRFDALDTNHDGVVTQNEFVAKAIADFRQFDVRGTGKVMASDIAASPKTQERAARVAERIVKRLDTNGDGVVTLDEFLAAAKQRFARIDKNADGFIDAGEIGHRHWAHGGKS